VGIDVGRFIRDQEQRSISHLPAGGLATKRQWHYPLRSRLVVVAPQRGIGIAGRDYVTANAVGFPGERDRPEQPRARGLLLGVLGFLDFKRLNLRDLWTGLILGALHIIIRLEIQPELMRRAEKTRETKRCIRTDAAPTAHDLIDTCCCNIQGARNSITRQLKRNHELSEQLLAWMNWLQFLGHHITPLVVIHYLYFGRTLRRPYKTKAPLVINANAVLPFAIPIQRFKPIARRRRQISQEKGGIQLAQLAARHRLDVPETGDSNPQVQGLRITALERLDSHRAYSISIRDIAQCRRKSLHNIYYNQCVAPAMTGASAKIARIDEPGTLKDRLDSAWLYIKHKLVRGLSIGFAPVETVLLEGGGLHFLKWNWLGLSAVTIPANATAGIGVVHPVSEEQMRTLRHWRQNRPRRSADQARRQVGGLARVNTLHLSIMARALLRLPRGRTIEPTLCENGTDVLFYCYGDSDEDCQLVLVTDIPRGFDLEQLAFKRGRDAFVKAGLRRSGG